MLLVKAESLCGKLPAPNWFQKHILNLGWRWENGSRDVSTLEWFIGKYILYTVKFDRIFSINLPLSSKTEYPVQLVLISKESFILLFFLQI